MLDRQHIGRGFDHTQLAAVTRGAVADIADRGFTQRAALLAMADTVTDLKASKHAFDAGVKVQKGIDY
jgi:ATP:corrinoid adenosyltransferase